MNECQLDSEDDEFDVDDSVDYSEGDEYFDNNIDKEVKWGGFEEEVPVNEDCPPISQPEDPIQQEAELPTTKKPVRRAIFAAEVEPVVVQEPVPSTMHFHNVNRKPAPVPPLMHPKLNIGAPPPMVGHPPGFVSKPITGPVVPNSYGPTIMKDGKRYITLSNLNTAMQSEQPKDKGKRMKK
ncbi:hypothetical protein Salat_1654700 [Sesamum alatum]|uniref:Uncharacterized protein n=1 Tax=Sesamum alatum TaxID=300844 RepID=A0AAE2CJM7_9LAMI|nr:hypothetical protein Salat_1654700 [Sesamum alatum]